MQYAHVRVAGVLMLGYFALYASASSGDTASDTTSSTGTSGTRSDTGSFSEAAPPELGSTGIRVRVKWKIPGKNWLSSKLVEQKRDGTLNLLHDKVRFDNGVEVPIERSADEQKLVMTIDGGSVTVLLSVTSGSQAILELWSETFRKEIKIPVTSRSRKYDGNIVFHDIIKKTKLKHPRLYVDSEKYYKVKMNRDNCMEYEIRDGRIIVVTLEVDDEWKWAIGKLNIRLNDLAIRKPRERKPRRYSHDLEQRLTWELTPEKKMYNGEVRDFKCSAPGFLQLHEASLKQILNLSDSEYDKICVMINTGKEPDSGAVLRTKYLELRQYVSQYDTPSTTVSDSDSTNGIPDTLPLPPLAKRT